MVNGFYRLSRAHHSLVRLVGLSELVVVIYCGGRIILFRSEADTQAFIFPSGRRTVCEEGSSRFYEGFSDERAKS